MKTESSARPDLNLSDLSLVYLVVRSWRATHKSRLSEHMRVRFERQFGAADKIIEKHFYYYRGRIDCGGNHVGQSNGELRISEVSVLAVARSSSDTLASHPTIGAATTRRRQRTSGAIAAFMDP
jgi:hypothetical protein